MSTKKIRATLDHYRRLTGPGRIAREVDMHAVLDELEAIEKAARDFAEANTPMHQVVNMPDATGALLLAIAKGGTS